MDRIGEWWSSSRQLVLFCLLIGVLAFSLARVIALADTGKTSMGARAKKGDALFHQYCISCHNKEPGDTSPFGPPNLHGIFSKPAAGVPITPEQAMTIIKQGRSPMPSFAGVLSDSQISALIAYLKSQ